MKKYIGVVVFTIILFICNVSHANIIVENKEVIAGQDVTLTVKSDIALGSYTVLLEELDGLEFITSMGQEGSGKQIITGSTTNGETQLAKFTLKVPDDMKNCGKTVKIKVYGMETPQLLAMDNQEIRANISIKEDIITPVKRVFSRNNKKYIGLVLQNNDDILTKRDLKSVYSEKNITSNESQLSNGSKVNMENEEYITIIYGDVDSDGEINILDAVKVLNYLKGKIQLSEEELLAANIKKDGEIDIFCAVKILNVLKGKVSYQNILD